MTAVDFSDWVATSPPRLTRTLFWLAETGPKADVLDVCVNGLVRGATVQQSEVIANLDAMVGQGILTRSGQTYAMTDDTIESFVRSTALGCTGSEFRTAPAWVQALATGEDVHAPETPTRAPFVIPADAWKLVDQNGDGLFAYLTAHGAVVAGGRQGKGIGFAMALDGRRLDGLIRRLIAMRQEMDS
jgi:hypothetical protein